MNNNSSQNLIAECDNCKLCEITRKPEQEREVQDTLLGQTEHFQWIPGLGAFIEGYSLIVSKKHILNTGSFDVGIVEELELFIRKIKKALNNIYNKGAIVFEHGSMGNHNYAGNCIDHQHIHIIPTDLQRVPLILTEKFVSHGQLQTLKDLILFSQKQIPYIYCEFVPGKHNVYEVPVLPRQYLRQVVATECGYANDWDWREKPFLENIITFVGKTKGRI